MALSQLILEAVNKKVCLEVGLETNDSTQDRLVLASSLSF